MERYERAVAEFRGPDFDRLLDDVRARTETTEDMAKPADPLPRPRPVVIIGGGVIGTSVAYHLTKLG